MTVSNNLKENTYRKMDKEKIAEKILALKHELMADSKDAPVAAKKIDELLSLKGQLDIAPTIVHIPLTDVAKEYDNDNIVVYRCKTCIIWQIKGGKINVVYPTMRAEYEFLSQLLDMKDNYESLTKDEKTAYDACYLGYSTLTTLPSFVVSSDKWFSRAAILAARGIIRMSTETMEEPLRAETPIEDAEFTIKRSLIDGLAEEVDNAHKKDVDGGEPKRNNP